MKKIMSNPRKLVMGIVATIVGIVFLSMIGRLFEEVDAGEVVIIQKLDGDLEVYDQPTSFAWQGLGKVTHYRRSNQFEFKIPIGFNDGGYGTLIGSVRYDLPKDKASMIRIHTHFNSQSSVESHLIRTNIEKAAFASGPLMSSRESFAEKKNDLIFYVEDQASKGAYRTRQVEVEEIDPLMNTKKVVTKVQILKDSLNRIERQEVSPIVTEGIRLYNLSLKQIDYDDKVKAQIASQQQSIMAVQTSIAEAKRAEQKAITIEKEGEAEAARAKWDQEVIKAKLVTEAQGQKEKATLDVQTAMLIKQKLTLEGEGEAAKKRAAMAANGALEQKLEAWVKVQGYWADAFKNSQNPLVPTYMSGGGMSGNAANNFMDLMMMKTAKDLNLDINKK
jgi:hypothetical protein